MTIPAGVKLLSDQIISSPILMGDSDGAGPSGSGGAAGGSEGQFEFGVDPSMDPELAMALRMSLEEEQARQRAAEGTSTSTAPDLPSIPEAAKTDAPSDSKPALPSTGSLVLPGADAISGTGEAAQDENEDAMLKQALALSQGQAAADTQAKDEDVEMGEQADDDDVDEEEAIARAIEMSLKKDQGTNDK